MCQSKVTDDENRCVQIVGFCSVELSKVNRSSYVLSIYLELFRRIFLNLKFCINKSFLG
jgi:hypothetical protein